MLINKIGDLKDFTVGDKCTHPNNGHWLVVKGKTVYGFDYNNNMALHGWLDEAKNDADKEKRRGTVRWFCRECNNIQIP